jgi:hypothetical protein
MKDRFHNTGRVKAVPIRLDDGDNASTDGRVNIRTNKEILFELGKVTLAIPEMDVRASVGEGSGGMADGFARTFKKEYTLVNVVTVVHRNIVIGRFGSPQLRRDINDKGMSGRKER